ncbi:MAG: type IV pilin, partial [Methanoregula sp.]|nr:type IV pilin [Methanoregula sp.]
MTPRKTAPLRAQITSRYDHTAGVSEVIGAILLVALVVAAVALVAVFLFSQSTPVKVPNVNFMVGTNNQVPPTLYLTHNGGDTLTVGSFSVYIDGKIKSYSVAGGGNEWSLGKNLLVPLSSGETPQRIYLVYNQTGTGSSVIGSASANVSVPSGKIAPDIIVRTTSAPVICINGSDPQAVLGAVLSNVSVIGAAINQSPSTVGPVIATAVGANSTNF